MSNSSSSPVQEVSNLYQHLLTSWNQQNASEYAAHFTEEGNVVGFDGSQMNKKEEIEEELRQIFKDHKTAKYVSKIREVRILSDKVVMLRAIAGMIPPGQSELNPNANAIQTLVATKSSDGWKIEMFHNTPAAFHGRPKLSQELTDELSKLL